MPIINPKYFTICCHCFGWSLKLKFNGSFLIDFHLLDSIFTPSFFDSMLQELWYLLFLSRGDCWVEFFIVKTLQQKDWRVMQIRQTLKYFFMNRVATGTFLLITYDILNHYYFWCCGILLLSTFRNWISNQFPLFICIQATLHVLLFYLIGHWPQLLFLSTIVLLNSIISWLFFHLSRFT
jgi:hypothetical protein